MNNLTVNNDNEIKLKEIFLMFWKRKGYIIFFSVLSFIFASIHLQDAERLYLVKYDLKPVRDSQQKNSYSGLGGIASLAGIQLPSNSSSDFEIFKQLMSTVEVSEKILENKELIKNIYENEWDSSLNSFSEPPKSKARVYISDLKNIITGNDEVRYIPPNAKRLANYISENILMKEDKDTGFLALTAKTSKPDMLLSLMSIVIETSDQIMRQRYINFSIEPLAFYKEKIRTTRSREHREALAELIGKEEQKLMFASRGKYFIAEPYIQPSISLRPISPKPKLILLFSLVFGSFMGCFMILLRNVIVRDEK